MMELLAYHHYVCPLCGADLYRWRDDHGVMAIHDKIPSCPNSEKRWDIEPMKVEAYERQAVKHA